MSSLSKAISVIAELLAALSNVFFIFISYLFISFRHVSMYEYFLQYRIANGGTSRVNSPQFSCPKTALQIESRLELFRKFTVQLTNVLIFNILYLVDNFRYMSYLYKKNKFFYL